MSTGRAPQVRTSRLRQGGVALIQVLLVTALMMLLVLQLSLTAREQVRRAQAIVDRAEADLAARSHEAALQYALLTQPWGSPVEAADDPYARAWNFGGQPFEAGNATVRIADQAGRLVVPLFGDAPFVQLLQSLGVDDERARRLGQQLLDLQGTRRAGTSIDPTGTAVGQGGLATYAVAFPVQTIDELRRLPDMDAALYARLAPLLTLYPATGFNPLTAPDELLVTRLSDSQRDAVLELRASGTLDERALYRIAGIQADDFTNLSAGPAFHVDLQVRRGGVVGRRTGTFVIRPYQNEAVGIWSRR